MHLHRGFLHLQFAGDDLVGLAATQTVENLRLAPRQRLTLVAALKQALAAEGGGRIKPINLTVDYMRGGRDKPTRAKGMVTRLGKRVANVEAIAWQDERDRPIAAARINYLIVR